MREGAGPTVSRNYQVGNFHELEVAGPYDVQVRTGGNPGVSASGGEKLLERTVVEVRGDKLVIRPEEQHGWFHFGWGSRGKATFTVKVPQLSGATIAGSGDTARPIIISRILGGNPMRVNVTAQQFAWSFSYPGAKNLTTGTLRLPVNRSVLLTFTSKDVIHSFWVPEFGQKQDTVPGLHPTLHITPNRIGTYPVICTELCGLGHAVMRTTAVVMPRAAFAKWLKSQTAATSSPSPSVSGATVFKNNPCGSCHTLAAAGSTGKIGPDLDKLPQYAHQAGQPLEQFVHTSIVDPNAYVQKGYPKNVMPPFANLPKDQLDALVQYLIQSSKKG